MTKQDDSNSRQSKIQWVCNDCGKEALRLPVNKGKSQFEMSTFHKAKCDVCHEVKSVTEARDFGYPVFNIKNNHQMLKEGK